MVGLGVMLVRKGGAADEGGGDSPSSSGFLQSVGLLGWGRCVVVLAVTGWQRSNWWNPRSSSFGGLGCSGSIAGMTPGIRPYARCHADEIRAYLGVTVGSGHTNVTASPGILYRGVPMV